MSRSYMIAVPKYLGLEERYATSCAETPRRSWAVMAVRKPLARPTIFIVLLIWFTFTGRDRRSVVSAEALNEMTDSSCEVCYQMMTPLFECAFVKTSSIMLVWRCPFCKAWMRRSLIEQTTLSSELLPLQSRLMGADIWFQVVYDCRCHRWAQPSYIWRSPQ